MSDVDLDVFRGDVLAICGDLPPGPRAVTRRGRSAAPAMLLALWPSAACAGDLTLAELNGQWRGSGKAMVLDTERMQGNFDPERPFGREPLRIRNIAGRMVVFTVGDRQYIAHVEADRMALTAMNTDESLTLVRVRW